MLRDLLGKFVQFWRHISQVIGIRKLGFRLYLSVSRRPASLVRRRATTAPPRRRGPGPRLATSFKYNLRRNPSSNSIVRDITCHCTSVDSYGDMPVHNLLWRECAKSSSDVSARLAVIPLVQVPHQYCFLPCDACPNTYMFTCLIIVDYLTC